MCTGTDTYYCRVLGKNFYEFIVKTRMENHKSNKQNNCLVKFHDETNVFFYYHIVILCEHTQTIILQQATVLSLNMKDKKIKIIIWKA